MLSTHPAGDHPAQEPKRAGPEQRRASVSPHAAWDAPGQRRGWRGARRHRHIPCPRHPAPLLLLRPAWRAEGAEQPPTKPQPKPPAQFPHKQHQNPALGAAPAAEAPQVPTVSPRGHPEVTPPWPATPGPQQVPPARLTAVGQAQPGQAEPRRPEPAQRQRHRHRRPHPAAAPSARGGTEPLWGRHPTAPGPPRPGPAPPNPSPGRRGCAGGRPHLPGGRGELRAPQSVPASNALVQ